MLLSIQTIVRSCHSIKLINKTNLFSVDKHEETNKQTNEHSNEMITILKPGKSVSEKVIKKRK